MPLSPASPKVTKNLKAVNTRLDRIEHLLLYEQKRESEDVATYMKRLKDALAL